jgi:hypothetical protein
MGAPGGSSHSGGTAPGIKDFDDRHALEASRDLRIAALRVFPELVRALMIGAKEGVSTIQKAKGLLKK